MPYYAGDYYTGDYYQGDNYGAYQAGGFFKALGRGLGGLAKGLLRATPLGGAVAGLLPSGPRRATGIPVVPEPGIAGVAHRVFPGGSTGLMVGAALGGRRRMNPLNIKALRRAMRRAKGFERQARRVGSFFNPGKTFRLKGRARKRR